MTHNPTVLTRWTWNMVKGVMLALVAATALASQVPDEQRAPTAVADLSIPGLPLPPIPIPDLPPLPIPGLPQLPIPGLPQLPIPGLPV